MWGRKERTANARDGRVALAGITKAPGFRVIDLARDDFERNDVAEREYPADRTALYWWLPSFWRLETDEVL